MKCENLHGTIKILFNLSPNPDLRSCEQREILSFRENHGELEAEGIQVFCP